MSASRLRSFAARGGLALAVLTLSHEIAYQLGDGPGSGYAQAMRKGGHDGYWSPYVIIVALIVASLVSIAVVQLVLLSRLASRCDARTVVGIDADASSFASGAKALWFRLAALATLAFLVQENIEIAMTGEQPPGLAILADHHGIALPVLLAVSLIVAAIAALVGWRRAILLWRIRAARVRPAGRPSASRPIPWLPRAQSRIEGRSNAVRAPPALGADPA